RPEPPGVDHVIRGRAGRLSVDGLAAPEEALDAGELLQDLGVAGVGGRDAAPQIVRTVVTGWAGGYGGSPPIVMAGVRVFRRKRSGAGRREQGRALVLCLAQALAQLEVHRAELLKLRGECLLHGLVALLGSAELLVEDRELPLEGAD